MSIQERVSNAKSWEEFTPKEAANLSLDLGKEELQHIKAPLNEIGERCPWPWEPEQLGGAPIGQFRCSYCNAMVMAGMKHVDYAGDLLA